MLRSLFGSDWKKSDAHLLLLSKFSKPRQIEDFTKYSDWEDVLEEKPKKAIERFSNEKYLAKGDLSYRLAYKFKVSELKDLLRERNLKLSGSKDELTKRLAQADTKGMQKLVGKLEVYKLTSLGNELVEKYKKEKDAEHKKAEELTIDALRRREFRNASEIIANYEAKQVFPRGMGIDWDDYDTENDEAVLRNIFNKKPKQLEKYSDNQLEPFRIAAGMFHMAGWNRGDVSEWLSVNQSEQLDYEADEIALMINSHAIHLRDREEINKLEIELSTDFGMVHIILTCNDDLVCDECKKIASRKYQSLDELPILPYEKCTSENGCRCSSGSEFDDSELDI